MKMRVKEVDLHVTTNCSGHCAYCYVGSGENAVFQSCKGNGDTETLMKVIRNIRLAGKAEDLVFVGGDPCEHPDLVTLLKYAKSLGLHTCVLSNTHVYRDGGMEVPMETVVKYLDEIDFTLHGMSKVHDAFNGNPGMYREVTERIKKFMRLRSEDQSVGVVLNLTPETIKDLKMTVLQFIDKVGLNPKQDFFLAQRIAPTGRARDNYERWKLTRQLLQEALDTFYEVNVLRGFELMLDAVDAVPWCAVPEEYLEMLTPGGCRWGQPGGVLSCLPDGGIQRCALSGRVIGNFLELNTPKEFSEFMRTNPTLVAFREKRHLAEKCRKCKLLDKCGGGCVIAMGEDPYATDQIPVGQDYLSE